MENFSQSVRNEVIHTKFGNCVKCLRAELAAIIHMTGSIHLEGQARLSLSIRSESAGVARRMVKLLKASYNFEAEIRVEQWERLGKVHRYAILIPEQVGLREMLFELGVLSREHTLEGGIPADLVQNSCCRASFLRGAYLSGGSLTDPRKTYHMELVTQSEDFANGLIYLMNLVGLKAKISQRKQSFLVYLKESDAIVKFLSLINAYTAVIKLEEIRVIKGLRENVNRKMNCDAANLEKTLNAAWEQTELINALKDATGLGVLPAHLHQTAELRLDYPEATLKELAELHLPPLSKSAVNHRLRQIREFVKIFFEDGRIFKDQRE